MKRKYEYNVYVSGKKSNKKPFYTEKQAERYAESGKPTARIPVRKLYRGVTVSIRKKKL